jgi:hypothetical protein
LLLVCSLGVVAGKTIYRAGRINGRFSGLVGGLVEEAPDTAGIIVTLARHGAQAKAGATTHSVPVNSRRAAFAVATKPGFLLSQE